MFIANRPTTSGGPRVEVEPAVPCTTLTSCCDDTVGLDT